jgi:hypothetical protein
LDRYGITFVGSVLIYGVAVLVLKRFIRRIDRGTQPFLLQLRDFSVVRQELARASSKEDKQFCERLLCAMYFTVAFVPSVIVASLLVAFL